MIKIRNIDFCCSQVRSKIAQGACDQPKAGCMGPVVSCSLRLMVKIFPDKL